MQNIFQKKWVIVLLVFAVIGTLAAFILRLITPQQPVVPRTPFITTDQSGQELIFNDIRFTGTPPQVPDTLPFAVIQPSQTSLDYVRNQLIEKHALSQVTGIESLWRGESYTLSYDSHSDEFLFYAAIIPEDDLLESSFQAIEQAQAFVQETFPNLSLTAYREGVVYFQGLDELEETTPNAAAAIEVPFTYTVENIPVYLGHARSAPIEVIINNRYQVQKVVFQPAFFDFIPTEARTPVISVGAALENINEKNEGVVVSASEETNSYFTLEEIAGGELTAVRLEYRADTQSGFAYPFYRFTGTLTNQDGQAISAQIITPAVAVQQ